MSIFCDVRFLTVVFVFGVFVFGVMKVLTQDDTVSLRGLFILDKERKSSALDLSYRCLHGVEESSR